MLHASDLDDLIATTLATAVASVTNVVANEIVITFVAGIGRMTVTTVYTPAQQTTVTWGGTLVDGEYSVRFVSSSPAADVTVDNDRAGGTPANTGAMAVALEAAAEALIATTLAGVLVSADDSASVNTLIFEPGVTCTVTASVTPNTTHTFGGTATDGAYVTRFTHSSLPGGSLDITTTRAAGSPATNTDLANAFEADVEARALLSLLLDGYFTDAIKASLGSWRRIVAGASLAGFPVPAFASSLSYYDGLRAERHERLCLDDLVAQLPHSLLLGFGF